MPHPMIALWAVPRSVSTAFERMMMERGDFTVFHEPFSMTYYYSRERVSHRFSHEPGDPKNDFDSVMGSLIQAADRSPVFFKDMAYHLGPRLDRSVLERFINVFLIRDPAQALPSLHHVWPDFTWEEAGYQALHRAFQLAREITAKTPFVMDSTDLLEHPQAVVKAFCENVGIPFLPEALEWDAGHRPEWGVWGSQGWHDDAASRRGFEKKPKKYLSVDENEHLASAYAKARPLYEELYAHRFQVES
ncbi:hypothetical protein SAMN02746041_02369 [Desulfacinum hydrothermale DSM 13146]|uniref:Sulfotransferase family protein n=2 Tax=Desulfacinum hydrothermale TaxID=109258 RepID=A0A1W1XNW4_9BACT|nr:hypothetical protein SAMN02746041_02369 [Desulfacinum hydrothermale DSM 13146]